MKLWIARDYTGLWAFGEKPDKERDEFLSNTLYSKLDSELFPEITFENSPQQIEIKIVKVE